MKKKFDWQKAVIITACVFVILSSATKVGSTVKGWFGGNKTEDAGNTTAIVHVLEENV